MKAYFYLYKKYVNVENQGEIFVFLTLEGTAEPINDDGASGDEIFENSVDIIFDDISGSAEGSADIFEYSGDELNASGDVSKAHNNHNKIEDIYVSEEG